MTKLVNLKDGAVTMSLGYVKTSETFVDGRAQRDPVAGHIKYLKTEWNDFASGVIVVSRRKNGRYAVIDGQNRTLAMKDIDPSYEFAAQIFSGLTPKQEAELFLFHNEYRKKVEQYDNFKIAQFSGSSTEVAISKLLDAHGLKVGKGANATTIAAIKTLRDVWETNGSDVLDQAIPILKSAWPADGDTWCQEMIRTVCHILYKAPDVNRDRLIVALEKRVVPQWKSLLAAEKATAARQVTAYLVLSQLVAKEYDKGRRNNKLGPQLLK